MKAIDIEWDFDGEDLSEEEKEAIPTEIDIPDEIEDEEEISDFISNKTGWCHKGFVLKK